MHVCCCGKCISQERSFSSEPCWYNCKYWNQLMLLRRQNCHVWYNHKRRKYPLIIMHGIQTLLSFWQKLGRQGINKGKKSTFAMPWAQGNPSGKFCTFGLKTGFWLGSYLCQLQFFHLLPGVGSVLPLLKAIDLQHWATMVAGMQGDPEHWSCQYTHAGEMKNPRQDKEIPLLHEMQLYSY